jgi:hypothetical protein
MRNDKDWLMPGAFCWVRHPNSMAYTPAVVVNQLTADSAEILLDGQKIKKNIHDL